MTTRYIPVQDRICLTGELPGGQHLVLWLSQRLWLRLLPGMFAWLQTQQGALPVSGPAAHAHQEMQQVFAVAAARADMQAAPPVLAVAGTAEWLVDAASVSHTPQHLCLVFKHCGGSSAGVPLAGLQLSAHQLRQWLLMVHNLWMQAEWPPAAWPAWWAEAASTHVPSTQTVH